MSRLLFQTKIQSAHFKYVFPYFFFKLNTQIQYIERRCATFGLRWLYVFFFSTAESVLST